MNTSGEGNASLPDAGRGGELRSLDEGKFRQLVDDLQVGVLVQGPAAEVQYGNKAALELLGVTPEQLLGSTSFDADRLAVREDGSPFPGADHPGPVAIATSKPVRNVIMGFLRPSTRERIWLLVNADPQLDPEGRVAQVICTFTDMSDRKQAEERLEESEARYRQLVERAPDIIYRTDVKGHFTYVNPAASRFMGYPEKELLGRHFLELIHEDHRSRVEGRLVRQFRERTPSTYDEFVALTKDRREVWIGQNVQLLTEGERVHGFQAVARDITERKTAEGAFERERRQLLDIVGHAPVAMAVLDREARYVACSEAWLDEWGVRGQRVIGRGDEALFRRRSRKFVEGVAQALQGRVVANPEDEFHEDDGSTAFVRWYAHPWRHPDGQVAGAVVVVQDIDVLVRARQAALDAAQVKTEFLTSLGQRLRRPVAGLLSSTRLLHEAGLAPRLQEQVDAIAAAARSLSTVIDGVLEFSRIESGRVELGAVDFDLRVAVREVLASFGPVAAAKDLRLEALVDDDLPGTLRGDPWRLRQVLTGLVDNATKFTEEGGVVLRVRLDATSEDGLLLRFEVADTGPGIPPATQAGLFRPFARPDSAGAEGGTGLGLAICRRLVEAMGGMIGVRSQPGQGSRFWFTVRLAQPDAQARARGAGGEAAGVAPEGRILVVEDNKVNQKVTAAMLQNLGYDADLASDGLAAVESCARTAYDAILMDCQLPGLDGFKATAWIRQREQGGKRTPIIAVTASTLPGDRESCLAAGMDDYLSKPVRLDALGAILKRWVTRAPAPALAPEAAALPADHALRVLEAQGMSRVVMEIIEVFLETTPHRLRELREASRRGDAEALRSVAHSLNGASAQIGATAMSELCVQILAAGRSGSTSAAGPLLDALESSFHAVSRSLEAERRRLAGGRHGG